MKKMLLHWNGYVLAGLGHIVATAVLVVVTALLVLPWDHAEGVLARVHAVPQLWEMSRVALALHVGIAACVWALLYIAARLVMLRIEEGKRVRHVKLSTGAILTETLIVMPVFLLLTFGLAQLTINNIGGVLANVAAYEAARAAWVWQPEEDAEDRRMNAPDGIAEEKCRIAVAFAMMPIAPGDLKKSSKLDSAYADQARRLAVGANIPLSGVLGDELPAEALDFALAFASTGDTNELAYNTALDSSSFIIRSARKFTAAFQAAKCEIRNDHRVVMTYDHRVAMPVVGPIFGDRKLEFETVGRRAKLTAKYITTYEREFGFPRQIAAPNRALPLNHLREDPPAPAGLPSEDDVARDYEDKMKR